jgi:hypothetical protein
MKDLKILLVVVLIITPLYAAYLYMDSMLPIWTSVEARKSAIELEKAKAAIPVDTQSHAIRSQGITIILLSLGGALVVLLVGFSSVLIWRIIDLRREQWVRPVDGSFALKEFKGDNGQVYLTDPNKSVFGVIGFDKPSAQLITDAAVIGPDRQLDYVKSVQKTRTASATTGDDGIKYTAHAKLISGYYDKPPFRVVDAPRIDPTDPKSPWQPIALTDAFSQAGQNKWILGQSPTSGELFELDLKAACHFGVIGATGTGKTAYIGLLLMALALKSHFRFVVLDGKGGSDWSKYRSLVEYQPLDYSNVRECVGVMTEDYKRRQTLLNQYEVNSIWELPVGVQKPRPTIVLCDEFGATMDSLRASSKSAYSATELELGNLLRLSRGAGMSVVLCDQNPSKWPGTIRANMPMNICFRLGGNIGNAVQEYNLDRLERKGQFQVSGNVYDAFPTYQVIDELLPTDYKKPRALLTGPSSLDRGRANPRLTDDTTPPDDLDEQSNGHMIALDETLDGEMTLDGPRPRLEGKPISQKDKATVREVYNRIGKYKEASIELWGSWHQGRTDWIKEVLAEQV